MVIPISQDPKPYFQKIPSSIIHLSLLITEYTGYYYEKPVAVVRSLTDSTRLASLKKLEIRLDSKEKFPNLCLKLSFQFAINRNLRWLSVFNTQAEVNWINFRPQGL